MKNHPFRLKFAFVLLSSLSAATMLSACDMLGDNIPNPFSDNRKPQQVLGARRVPLLNQDEMNQPPPAPQTMVAPPPSPNASGNFAPPAQAAVVAPPNANPYDYYDAAGNPIAPKAAAPEAASSNASSQGGFFDRLFGGSHNNADVQKSGMDRKPLPGNPYYSNETTPAAPIPPGPQSSAAPLPEQPSKPVILLAAQEPEPTPAEETKAAPPPEQAGSESSPAEKKSDTSHLPSWLSRSFGRDEKDLTPDDKAAMKAPETELSSVPPKPKEFEDVKAAEPKAMQEMKDEQAAAEQQKQALDSEPSQQQVTPPVNVTPATANTAEHKSGESVLLGHVAATQPVVTMDKDSATHVAAPATSEPAAQTELAPERPARADLSTPPMINTAPANSATAEVKPEAPPQEAEAAPPENHPNYWWQGWDIFHPKPKKPEAPKDEPPAEAAAVPPVEETSAPNVAVPDVSSAQTNIRPLLDTVPPQMESSAIPSAPTVAASEPAVPQTVETVNTSAETALPSPQILQTVRTLPPSRYADRQRAVQPPADDQ